MRETITHIMGKGKKTKNPASGYLNEALGLLFKIFVSSKECVKRAYIQPQTGPVIL